MPRPFHPTPSIGGGLFTVAPALVLGGLMALGLGLHVADGRGQAPAPAAPSASVQASAVVPPLPHVDDETGRRLLARADVAAAVASLRMQEAATIEDQIALSEIP